MHAMLTDITSRESSWWFEAGFVVHVHVRACVHVRCCFTSTETERTTRDGEPRTSTSTFTQLLSSVFQCCFTSTETVQTINNNVHL